MFIRAELKVSTFLPIFLIVKLVNFSQNAMHSVQEGERGSQKKTTLLYSFAFSKRKLCNGENFRIKDFDEFRCF